MKKENPTTAIVEQQTNTGSLAQPIKEFNPELQVEQARVAAKALMSVISQKPKKVEFNGEQYLEFEDWQTIAQFYNHTVGIEKTEQIEQSGKIIGFVAKAVIYNREGIVVGGAEAACMNDEDNWKTDPHPNKYGKTIPGKPLFQLRSMAQTRAMAKALRSRFGFVAVLAGFKPTPAEEMDGVASPVTAQTEDYKGYPAQARPASNKQMSYIRALLDQKGVTTVTNAQIDKLTSAKAKEWIDKLLAMKDHQIGDGVDYDKAPDFDYNERDVINAGDMPN